MAGLNLCVVPQKPLVQTEETSEKDSDDDEIINVTAALELTKELHSKLSNNSKISGPVAATLLGLQGKNNTLFNFSKVDF